MQALLEVVVVLLCVTSCHAHINESIWDHIQLYKDHIKILDALLDFECSTVSQAEIEELDKGLAEVLNKLKIPQRQLQEKVIECQGEVVPVAQPEECQTATTFTQEWRLDHNASDIRPDGIHSLIGYACDLYMHLGWFRFSGKAGNRMLNRCVPVDSCGTNYPYWTDAEMPDEVGVVTNITAYGSKAYEWSFSPSSDRCKAEEEVIQVMRCSWDTPHDLIYQYTGDNRYNCFKAFCGMY